MAKIGSQFFALIIFTVLGVFGSSDTLRAADDYIILQSTTSTRNSGLLAAILPVFRTDTGIEVRVVAV
ncbi:MAG: hypothetical protein ACU0C9_01770, partial [Paracoccaceae bacterium]